MFEKYSILHLLLKSS